MSATEKAFEGTVDVVWVLVGVRIDDEVCVGRLSVNRSGDFSIGQTAYVAVEIGDLSIVFIFHGELDPRVYGVEASEKIVDCSLTIRRLNSEFGYHIIDVFFDERWCTKPPFLGDGEG